MKNGFAEQIDRKAFDLNEAAILLELYLLSRAGELQQSKVALIASDRLRELAQNRGFSVSDSFRSPMGLRGRLRSLAYIFEGKYNRSVPGTAVFREIVYIYRHDNQRYIRLLNGEEDGQFQDIYTEADDVIEEEWTDYSQTEIGMLLSGKYDDFLDYCMLIGKTSVSELNEVDFVNFRNTCKKTRKYTREIKALLNITVDADPIEKNTRKGKNTKEFSSDFNNPEKGGSKNPNSTHEYSSIPNDEKKLAMSEDISERSEPSLYPAQKQYLTVDFSEDLNLAFTKPVSFSYAGKKLLCDTWNVLYVQVCARLLENHRHVFDRLIRETKNGMRKLLVVDGEYLPKLTKPVRLATGYYVETNRSATELVKNIKILLDECAVDHSRLVIKYKKENSTGEKDNSVETVNKPLNVSVSNTQKQDLIIKVLEKRNVRYKDNRDRGGCLWIVDGPEFRLFLSDCMKAGYKTKLNCSPDGCRAFPNQPVWWTKEQIFREESDVNSSTTASEDKEISNRSLNDTKKSIPETNRNQSNNSISGGQVSSSDAKSETSLAGGSRASDNKIAELIKKVNAIIRYATDGIEKDLLFEKLSGYSTYEINMALEACHSVYILKKYYHRDNISDYQAAADILLEVINKQFAQNGNYTSAKQLYSEVRPRLDDFFFYNNAFDSRIEIYELSVHLFRQEKYKGNSFIFMNNMHIWKEEPDYPKDFHGLLIKYAREHGNVFTRDVALAYLEQIGSATPAQTFSNVLFNTGSKSFLQYDENQFVLTEALNINEFFIASVSSQIENLLEGEDYIATGEIDDYFYSTLPNLPSGIYWSALLLKDILRIYDTGFSTIEAGKDNDKKTLPAAIVRKKSSYLTFSDVVWNEISKSFPLPKEFTASEFREFLLDKGFIRGSEKMWNVHKTVAGDIRFYWTDNNGKVTIN